MRYRFVLPALVGTVLAYVPATLAEDTLWQIGRADRDYRDLEYFSDLRQYDTVFPDPVRYDVDGDEPANAFPWIHPGSYDAWAGRREHTITIVFALDEVPDQTCQLQIDLVDVHNSGPPKLHVDVNGQAAMIPLEPGAGDPSLVRPEAGKARSLVFTVPATRLEKGANQIALRTSDGSWITYDAIRLSRLSADDLPEIKVTLKPTVFFIEQDGALKQEFELRLSGIATEADVDVELKAGDRVVETARLGSPKLGVVSRMIHIEPTESPRQLTAIITAGNQTARAELDQFPQKKWRIYCAPSTHTDIGYTDVQDKVIERHNRNTDLALELASDFPLYHWNLESSWAAQVWLRAMPFHRHRALYEAARQDRVGIESTYLNMLTGLCSTEELIRNLYYSARLHRQHGVPFKSHTLTDAPSHVWGLPSVLAGAGIRYLSCGINGIRAPLLEKGRLHERAPFWWEGPDGARVLTWFTPGYSQAGHIGLRDGVDRMRDAIESVLYRYQRRDDYPYDALLLHGAYSDNVAIGRSIAQSVTDFSDRYAYPKVILCANDVFFKYIEENFADEIPTVRGCGGSWWEDGAGSSALETGLNRVAHQDIVAAEAAWAVALGAEQSSRALRSQFNRCWDNILLFDEHTWGAYNSMTEPTSDFVQRQWAIKGGYARDSSRSAERLLERGLVRLASQVQAPDGSVLVFNPSGRSRSGMVRVDIPRGSVIMDEGEVLPQQVVHEDELEDNTVVFYAGDVPPAGYRVYRVATDGGSLISPPKRVRGKVIENDHYRVTFDADSGAVASIIDKSLGTELVDQSSPYKMGQVIYDLGGDFTGRAVHWGPQRDKIKTTSPVGGEIRPAAAGAVFSSVKQPAKLDGFHMCELETILYEHERRIDFVLRLDKVMTYEREALYVAFPVAGANPRFRYEVAGANVRPNEDHLPGGCRDWFAVQRWVTVNTDEAAVAWTPIDTPLITLCRRTPGLWLDELEIHNGTIFAYALNNYWFTNYKAGQDRGMTFRFSLTSAKSIDPSTASRMGESAVQPLRAIRLHEKRGKKSRPATVSACRVEPAENVMLSTLKPADDGAGLILRLQETAGRDTEATVSVRMKGLTKASRCDLVERVQGPLELRNGKVGIKLGAHSLATIRFE